METEKPGEIPAPTLSTTALTKSLDLLFQEPEDSQSFRDCFEKIGQQKDPTVDSLPATDLSTLFDYFSEHLLPAYNNLNPDRISLREYEKLKVFLKSLEEGLEIFSLVKEKYNTVYSRKVMQEKLDEGRQLAEKMKIKVERREIVKWLAVFTGSLVSAKFNSLGLIKFLKGFFKEPEIQAMGLEDSAKKEIAAGAVNEQAPVDEIVSNPEIEEIEEGEDIQAVEAEKNVESAAEFFLTMLINNLLQAREKGLKEMPEEEKQALFPEALAGREISIAILGTDATKDRAGTQDAVYGTTRTETSGLADQIHVLRIRIGDGGKLEITDITLPRQLRVPEGNNTWGKKASPINTLPYFNPDALVQGREQLYPPEKMRDTLRHATGLYIDLMVRFDLDATEEIFQALFPEGLEVEIPEEMAYTTDFKIGTPQEYPDGFYQAYSEEFLEEKLDNPNFRREFFKKIDPNEARNFKAGNPTTEEIKEFIRNHPVCFYPGTYKLWSEELLYFMRCRQGRALVSGSGAGSSTAGREAAFSFVFDQGINGLIKRIINNSWKLTFARSPGDFLTSEIKAILGPAIEIIKNLERPVDGHITPTWEMEEKEIDAFGNEQFYPKNLSAYLEEYFDAIYEVLNDPELSGQVVRLFLDQGIPREQTRITLNPGQEVVDDGTGKYVMAGALAPENCRTIEEIIAYWKTLRDKIRSSF